MRLAIGASPADVLSLVVRESLAITTVGLTMGLGVAILLRTQQGVALLGAGLLVWRSLAPAHACCH